MAMLLTGWGPCRHCGQPMDLDTGKDATDSDACHSDDAVFGFHENRPEAGEQRA